MINTIFFDIGGVLLNIFPDRTIKYLSKISGLTEDEITDSFPEEAHNQYERGEISGTDFYKAVVNKLPTSSQITETEFWKAWSMLVGDETEVVTIMNRLSENYAIWLLSNTNPYHIFEEERFKLFDKIVGGIYSFEAGSRKPESAIYQKALETAGVKAEESLFIDDLIENVDAARSLNFNAIHFKSSGDLIQQFSTFGVL